MTDEPVFEPLHRGDPDWKAPDLAEAVEGWRCWQIPSQVPRFGLAPRLFSVAGTSGFFWKPRTESIAACKKGCDRDGGPGIPGENCSCGFYSAKSFEHLKSLHYHGYDEEINGYFRLIGVVANWGKIREGSLGWRAEKSYPVKLFLPYEAWRLAAPLKKTYGVQIAPLNILKDDYDNERDQARLKVRA